MLRAAALASSILLAICASVGPLPLAAAQSDEAKLKVLLEQAIRGDAVESADAMQRIADLVTGPLGKALGGIDYENLTLPQAVRLKTALEMVSGTLRARIFRATLPSDDRELFDRFVKAYPELTNRLFNDSEVVRLAALEQIPLDPGTGAGIMIAARVDDQTETVAMAALDLAEKFKDPVLARRLAFIVRDYTAAIRGGYFDASQEPLAATVAIFVRRATQILVQGGYVEHIGTIGDALSYMGRSRLWEKMDVAELLRASGKMHDARLAPALVALLDDSGGIERRFPGPAVTITQTLGDAALIGLVELFKLKAEEFGLVADETKSFLGYTDEKSRIDGRRAFRAWYAANGPKTTDSRPATQPGDAKKSGDAKPVESRP